MLHAFIIHMILTFLINCCLKKFEEIFENDDDSDSLDPTLHFTYPYKLAPFRAKAMTTNN